MDGTITYERSRKLKGEMITAALEMETNADQFINVYSAMVKKEREVKKVLNDSSIRFQGFFEKYEKDNIKIAEDAKELASKVNS